MNQKIKMKSYTLLLCSLLFSCRPVEERIKDHSYTDKWYYFEGFRYQVYQTRNGSEYILVLNGSESKFIRKYINK